MRKKGYRPYIILGLVLLGLFYIPKGIVEGARTKAAGAAVGAKVFAHASTSDIEELQAELLILNNQNKALRRRLLSEERISVRIKRVKELIALDEKKISDFYVRRRKVAEARLERELFFRFAEVIYREAANWNATVWINLGEKEVAVNSPVLKGENLIGLVEYVGKHRSRVRLLTDSSLIPSVRVAREGEYLAKGELYGSSSALWRGRSEILMGIGFNYDFEDEEGPARELRSGRPLDQLNKEETLSLMDVGDLLVTTGMDGVFPKDIPVAIITKIDTLKEGCVSAEIEARLCAGNLDNLLDVVILPPLTPNEDE